MNLYFDNASTSYPKPEQVAQAITHFINRVGGTYGRGSYPRVVESTSMVEDCRDLVAQKMGLSGGDKLFFTANATQASNTILCGLRLKGCKVLVSPMEHNAIMRPLQHLVDTYAVEVEVLPHDDAGVVDCARLAAMETRSVALIVINHQSNVNGVIQPIEQIVGAAGSIPVMVDLSQSLGSAPVELERWGVSYAIFTGHKSLLGPTGVGGFYALDPDSVDTAVYGGTGSHSDSFAMPDSYPDRFQAGTPNTVGLAGMLAALENQPQQQHTFDDLREMMCRIQALDSITLYCAAQDAAHINHQTQGELFSITHRTLPPSTLCRKLLQEYGIQARQGLHCAPMAHRTMGTFPGGTLRIAPSVYHTADDFNHLIQALTKICSI